MYYSDLLLNKGYTIEDYFTLEIFKKKFVFYTTYLTYKHRGGFKRVTLGLEVIVP